MKSPWLYSYDCKVAIYVTIRSMDFLARAFCVQQVYYHLSAKNPDIYYAASLKLHICNAFFF
jgi:hypothetical protein